MPDTQLVECSPPISGIGIESLREHTSIRPFPAPAWLHVWWARHRLAASRAAFSSLLGIHRLERYLLSANGSFTRVALSYGRARGKQILINLSVSRPPKRESEQPFTHFVHRSLFPERVEF
jgi:adenine-specific DNA methylase